MSVPDAPDLSGFSMLDLFRQEAEAQVVLLNEGLLALEQDPRQPERLASLMRAAHSLKGAARIVGLDPAVKVAHAMEDCFVAAQKQQVVLEPDVADVLLRGVDALAQIARVPEAEMAAWQAQHEAEREELLKALEAIPAGLSRGPAAVAAPAPPVPPRVEPPSPPPPAVDPAPSSPPPPSEARVAAEPSDRAVRVSSENLSRVLGMMGELLVQTRWFEPFAARLLALKRQQKAALRVLEQIGESVREASSDVVSASRVTDARQKLDACGRETAERLEEFESFARQATDLIERLYREGLASRMRPFMDGVQGFPRMVRDLARELNKKVRFEIRGATTGVDREILDKLEAPITHLLRNAVDHGLELPGEREAAGKPSVGNLCLEAVHQAGRLVLTITDDGRGFDLDRIRRKIVQRGLGTEDWARRLTEAEVLEFLFLPGFTTAERVTEISGRGVGLDVVRSLAHEVGGSVRAENRPGAGARFQMQLPITLSVLRALLVEVAEQPFAIPLARIECLLAAPPEAILTLESRRYLPHEGRNLGLVDARELLELDGLAARPPEWPVVVLGDRTEAWGLVVDQFLGECRLVVRTLDPRLGKMRDVSAASLLDDGTPVLILDTEDLVRSMANQLAGGRLKQFRSAASAGSRAGPKRILVADDSITVREMERKLLESRGYEVDVAVDGMEAWNRARLEHYDLVVSDVDMPRMNGLDLVRRLKQDPRLLGTPIVIVSYKDREEDRLLGLEAGATSYLTKSSFHDDSFLRTVQDLIGEP